MTSEQKRILESTLWNIANTLRGSISADQFRDYILGFIFYKYLSEKICMRADEILKNDGLKFSNLDESKSQDAKVIQAIKNEAIDELGYFLKPSELFKSMAKREYGADIIPELEQILSNIEKSTMGEASEDDFDNLFEDMDLNSTKIGRSSDQRNKLVLEILQKLQQIDFELENTESDVLGDAYEYLIAQFAANAGKKAGEFYTPQQVSTILSHIVTNGKQRLESLYDPTCGSGSLLLRVARQAEVDNFYGQEMNRTTYNLARMNMILHDVHFSKFDIQQEDTLNYPAHGDKKFKAIVANPPFSAKWSASARFNTDDRFSAYGVLAPQNKADFAFVQHMLYHLDDDGTMAVMFTPWSIIPWQCRKNHSYLYY